ncbi:MAG: hypothetical protein ABI183_01950 [Polyangiaceae bacterium]
MTRFSMRKKQLLVALLAGGGAMLFSASAFAQSTGPSAALTTGAVVQHYKSDGVTSAPHPNGGAQPSWISNADCQQNIIVRVPITMTGLPTSDTMQVWAGANGVDCTQAVNLSGTTQACWQVYSGGIAPVTSTTVDIKAQDIIAPLELAIGQKPVQYTPGTVAACSSITQSGPIPLTIYFLFANGAVGSSGADGTAATYALSVALIGPAAPSGITVLPGDTFLKVDWTPTTDSNTQGFQVFCDPPPGKEPAISDSGVSGATVTDSSTVEVCNETTTDGGFDDEGGPLPGIVVDGGCHYENVSSTSTVGGQCVSTEIVSGGGTVSTTGSTDDSGVVDTSGGDDGGSTTVVTGVTPPPADIGNYACGKNANVASPTSTEVVASGLKNDVNYVIGVAAYDVVGNIGPMGVGTGNDKCGSPAKGADFFNLYNEDGGGAGGGFCSLDKTQPVGTSAFALVGIASLISVVRRKKNKSKTSRGARS